MEILLLLIFFGPLIFLFGCWVFGWWLGVFVVTRHGPAPKQNGDGE